MNKYFLAVIALFAVSAPAVAEPFKGTISTGFAPGDSVSFPDGSSSLTFGYRPSTLTFTPVSTFSAEPNRPFQLGSFRFENISVEGAPSGTTFQAFVHFSNLEGVTGASFSYDVGISQDHGTLITDFTLNGKSDTTFRSPDGKRYTLKLRGFTDDPNQAYGWSNVFSGPFCATTTSYLWGSFVDPNQHCPTPQVPEPTAIALVGIGLAAVGLRQWSKSRNWARA